MLFTVIIVCHLDKQCLSPDRKVSFRRLRTASRILNKCFLGAHYQENLDRDSEAQQPDGVKIVELGPPERETGTGKSNSQQLEWSAKIVPGTEAQGQAELRQERRGHHQGIRYQVRLAGNRHCVEHAVSLVCTGDWYLKSFFPDSGLFWELNLLLRAQWARKKPVW